MNLCTIEGCEKPMDSRQMCAMHVARWRRNGDPLIVKQNHSLRSAPDTPMPERMASKLIAETGWLGLMGCWEWQAVKQKGYGRVGHDTSEANNESLAHRITYTLTLGPIPDGLTLDHLCRNRSCCNPFHLEPVTAVENASRGFGPYAINARKEICNNGHPLAGANLKIEASGSRRCRECANEAKRRHKAKKRMERAA